MSVEEELQYALKTQSQISSDNCLVPCDLLVRTIAELTHLRSVIVKLHAMART